MGKLPARSELQNDKLWGCIWQILWLPAAFRRLRHSLSRSCPLLQIDAFQGHHKRPWTITQRQFANNLQALCRPAAFFMAPFLLLPSNAPGDCFLAVFVAGAVFRYAPACSMWRDGPVWNSM